MDSLRIFRFGLIGLYGLGRIAQTVHSRLFSSKPSLILYIGSAAKLTGSNLLEEAEVVGCCDSDWTLWFHPGRPSNGIEF
jgi:hypothetical protein